MITTILTIIIFIFISFGMLFLGIYLGATKTHERWKMVLINAIINHNGTKEEKTSFIEAIIKEIDKLSTKL